MTNLYWPLFDLRLRTEQLELRPLREDDLATLAELLPADLEQNPEAPVYDVPDAHVRRGIVVHRIECKHAKGRPQDWIPLTWSDKVQGDFFAELRINGYNKRGLLARITADIANADSSIENVQMPDRAGGEAVEMRFVITVRDRVHLARVLRRIRRIDGIERVWRA